MSWLTAGKLEKQDSPSFGLRFSGQNVGTAQQSKPVTGESNSSQPGVKLTRAVESATAAQPPASPAAQVPVSPPAQPQARPAEPPQASPVAQPPAGAVAQAAAGPAKSFPFRQLDREEIADLMRRGEAFIATGDLASARLVLQRAAEGGDPRAALTLAGTYDPIVLEKLGIQGFASDIAAARTWYERAKEFGSAEAMRRLEMLASRAR
jgi:hypothetical protein